MNTSTKITGFAAALLVVFAAATGVGVLVGPIGVTAPAAADDHSAGHAPTASSAAKLPGGLMVSQEGYTLELERRQLTTEKSAPIRFRILGPDGRPVTSYTTAHGKDLHLIAVRRDLTHFQHVHPQLAPNGTWSVPLDLSEAGSYRVFADFTPADRDQGLTLGADLSVAGTFDPQPLPATSRTAEVDGYTVTLKGDLVSGGESELILSVSRNGQPVTDLQPYLEAYGHLVALRDRDLAYLHVHPAGSPGDGTTKPGPDITFYATAPSDGAYRLFLDFRHNNRVRTAEFTINAGTSGQDRTATPDTSRPPSVAPTTKAPTADTPTSEVPTHDQEPGDHGHGG